MMRGRGKGKNGGSEDAGCCEAEPRGKPGR